MDWRSGYTIVLSLLLLLVAVWVVRYFLLSFREAAYVPAWWRDALKKDEPGERLIKLEKGYADKVRFHTFWIQINRLRSQAIPGDFAELGVYKGDTASIMHAMDPQRVLHLFDTFSGFDHADLKVEVGKAATYTEKSFADTNLNDVLYNLGNPDNVKVYPGYFPDTVPDTQLRFSLVSIDVDLYQPTKAGLEYFFPRLSPGGVILVHDYNPDWSGVVKAVDEFLAANGACSCLMPDQDASILIFKD